MEKLKENHYMRCIFFRGVKSAGEYHPNSMLVTVTPAAFFFRGVESAGEYHSNSMLVTVTPAASQNVTLTSAYLPSGKHTQSY